MIQRVLIQSTAAGLSRIKKNSDVLRKNTGLLVIGYNLYKKYRIVRAQALVIYLIIRRIFINLPAT